MMLREKSILIVRIKA